MISDISIEDWLRHFLEPLNKREVGHLRKKRQTAPPIPKSSEKSLLVHQLIDSLKSDFKEHEKWQESFQQEQLQGLHKIVAPSLTEPKEISREELRGNYLQNYTGKVLISTTPAKTAVVGANEAVNSENNAVEPVDKEAETVKKTVEVVDKLVEPVVEVVKSVKKTIKVVHENVGIQHETVNSTVTVVKATVKQETNLTTASERVSSQILPKLESKVAIQTEADVETNERIYVQEVKLGSTANVSTALSLVGNINKCKADKAPLHLSSCKWNLKIAGRHLTNEHFKIVKAIVDDDCDILSNDIMQTVVDSLIFQSKVCADVDTFTREELHLKQVHTNDSTEAVVTMFVMPILSSIAFSLGLSLHPECTLTAGTLPSARCDFIVKHESFIIGCVEVKCRRSISDDSMIQLLLQLVTAQLKYKNSAMIFCGLLTDGYRYAVVSLQGCQFTLEGQVNNKQQTILTPTGEIFEEVDQIKLYKVSSWNDLNHVMSVFHTMLQYSIDAVENLTSKQSLNRFLKRKSSENFPNSSRKAVVKPKTEDIIVIDDD